LAWFENVSRQKRYFPWKIFADFVLRSSVFWTVLILGAGFSLRFFVFKTFLNSSSVEVALGNFDDYLTQLGLVVFALVFAFTLWAARYYFQPLGRILRRTRKLRRIRGRRSDDPIDDFVQEEPGEWTDLERAVERLNSDLRQRTEEYSREREEMAGLLGSVTNAILAIDKLEMPLFYNPQFALQFQIDEGLRSGARLGEFFRSPDVLHAFRNVLNSRKPAQVELKLRTGQSAQPRHFSLSVAPLINEENDELFGAVGVFNDVTELKAADQIRIEFVANASHELRSPLTNIKGYLDTVRDDLKSGRVGEVGSFLEIINQNVERMQSLVSDLLDLSAIESGAELKKAIVHTRDVTESVLKQIEIKRAQKRISIETDFGAETLAADARRVEQVLQNLVYNAIKYIPDGAKIGVRWTMEHDQSVRLIVKDSGPGIPAEHQARLFERFYRVDPGRSREQGGTGLGLSIVKHIMLKHGGSVQLNSRLGEGAEFICYFPPE
jgi:two-component system phosphate regulon sensor histidine kinase PhoR